jgi:hypothetical protein
MQRSISNKNTLRPYIYTALFVVYTALSGIYLFIPPLLAILFIIFSQALKKESSVLLILVSFCLIVFEAQNGYVLFSTIIYFTFLYKYIIPKLTQNFNCNICVKVSTVLFVYIGFFVFHMILSNVFMFPLPNINYYIIYYIVIEFFIMSIL